MENTFDINSFDKDRTTSPASFKQCQAVAYKFAKKGEKMNWRKKSTSMNWRDKN